MCNESDKNFTKLPLVERFAIHRINLVKKYKTAKAAMESGIFGGYLGRTRVYSIFSSNFKNENFTPKIMKAVCDVMEKPDDGGLSKLLSTYIFNDDKEFPPKLYGTYHYWRWFPKEENQTLFEIRRGIVNISNVSNEIVYRHRSANAPEGVEWEDEGSSAATNKRLYMVGLRRLNIRLAICHVPDDLSRELLHGIVLSTQEKTKKIFSCAFLMAHESNSEFFSRESFTLAEYKALRCCEPLVDQSIMVD